MIARSLLTAAFFVAVSAPALAFHCPKDMAAIDAAMSKNPSLSGAQMTEVKELRAAGEDLHNNGKHHASVTVLGRAMEILGIK